MVGASISEEEDGSSSVLSQKRKRSSISPGDGAEKQSLVLRDPDVLDCPLCFKTLTIPIFQCDNGHLACSSCCPKLSGKYPACALPIGHSRCRAMESVLESVFVPCPNAKLGCTKDVTYGKQSIHEQECAFSQCSCPALDCDYTGSYTDLFLHYIASIHRIGYQSSRLFNFGISFTAALNISDKVLIKVEVLAGLLFAVQCFREPCGVYVTVSCIAPSAPEVGKFSYHLSYAVDGHTMTYESPEVKRILEVSFQTPQENFMLILHSLLRGELLKMVVCIKRLNQK